MTETKNISIKLLVCNKEVEIILGHVEGILPALETYIVQNGLEIAMIDFLYNPPTHYYASYYVRKDGKNIYYTDILEEEIKISKALC